MLRLLLLVLAALPVFLGFTLPFLLPAWPGLLAGSLLVLAGAWLIWFVETRSGGALAAERGLNRLLKAGGDRLLENQNVDNNGNSA